MSQAECTPIIKADEIRTAWSALQTNLRENFRFRRRSYTTNYLSMSSVEFVFDEQGFVVGWRETKNGTRLTILSLQTEAICRLRPDFYQVSLHERLKPFSEPSVTVLVPDGCRRRLFQFLPDRSALELGQKTVYDIHRALESLAKQP